MSSALNLHKELNGKIEIKPKLKLNSRNLPLLYTPGVAEVALEIAKDSEKASTLTIKGNTIAIITDGSRLLGLGNQGPLASLPVMEGKALILKELAGINAFPICLDTQDPEKIIETVKYLAPSFGGINLEDIASPKCFIIERVLKKKLSIPVFHDDQHGTAIVTLAALINSLKIVKKDMSAIKTVILGAGAAGIAITHLLLDYGVKHLNIFDSAGMIHLGRKKDMNPYKEEIAQRTKAAKEKSFKEAMQECDVLITVSGKANSLTAKDLKGMARKAIIFSLSNPVPEISYKEAKKIGKIVASGGSQDYKNHVNNMLAFPPIWKGALESRAKKITKKMIIAAAEAIAAAVKPSALNENHILPAISQKGLIEQVAKKVRETV